MEFWRIDLEAFPSPLTSYERAGYSVPRTDHDASGPWRIATAVMLMDLLSHCLSPQNNSSLHIPSTIRTRACRPLCFQFLPGIPCTLAIASHFVTQNEEYLMSSVLGTPNGTYPLTCPSDKNKIDSSPRTNASQAVNI